MMFSMWCVEVCSGLLSRISIGDGIIPVLRARDVMSRMRPLERAGGIVLEGDMREREMRRQGMGLRPIEDLVSGRKRGVMREILRDSVGLQLDRSSAYLKLQIPNASLAIHFDCLLQNAN